MSHPLRIVGMDLSLTSTGTADCADARVYRTDASMPMEQRLLEQRFNAVDFVMAPTNQQSGFEGYRRADLVVMEGPSFGSKGPGHDELAGLRWMVRCELYGWGIPVAVVSPASLKRWTTGTGKASKADMVAAVAERYGIHLDPLLKVKDGRYDAADATALAALGYLHYEAPLSPSWPALDPVERLGLGQAVDWPKLGDPRTPLPSTGPITGGSLRTCNL